MNQSQRSLQFKLQQITNENTYSNGSYESNGRINDSTPLLNNHDNPYKYTAPTPQSTELPFPRSHTPSLWHYVLHFSHSINSQQILLGFLVICLTLCSSGELISRKILATNLYNYRWFLVEFIFLLSFLVSVALFAFNFGEIRASIRSVGIPLKALIILAVLDAFHSFLLMISIAVIPAPAAILIPALLIPFTLLFRFFRHAGFAEQHFLCRQRYLIGSILVFTGVFLSILPGLIKYHPCLPGDLTREESADLIENDPQAYAQSQLYSSRSQIEILLNIIILVVALIPAAASNVYKHTLLSTQHVNLHLLNAATGLFAVLLGLVIAPFIIHLEFWHNTHASLPTYEIISNVQLSHSINHVNNINSNAVPGYVFIDKAAGVAVDRSQRAPFDVDQFLRESGNNNGIPYARDSAAPQNSASNSATAPNNIGINNGRDLGDFIIDEEENDEEDEGSSWSSRVNHNHFINFYHGILCLAGINSEFGDFCVENHTDILIALIAYGISVVGLQLTLQRLLAKTSSENCITIPLAASMIIAFVAFYFDPISSLLPAYDTATCLRMSYTIIASAVCISLGLLITQYVTAIDEQELAAEHTGPIGVKSIAVWTMLEDIEYAEELHQLAYQQSQQQQSMDPFMEQELRRQRDLLNLHRDSH
jgi:hypothetical protein